MGVDILPACLSVHHMCAKWLWMPEEGTGVPRTGVTDGLICQVGSGKGTWIFW